MTIAEALKQNGYNTGKWHLSLTQGQSNNDNQLKWKYPSFLILTLDAALLGFISIPTFAFLGSVIRSFAQTTITSNSPSPPA